jgi:hypothetical protein
VLNADQLERIKNGMRELVRDLSDHDDRDPSLEAQAEAAESGSQAEREVAKPSPPAAAVEQLAPAWRTDAPVLCLAGRGTLDEAATAMLAQLLTKHNLGSRVAPHEAASREHIPALNIEGVAMVCISYLEISGSPAHLRYLVRRLRGRLPTGTPILVGLWRADDEVLHDDGLQSLVGADHYTTSLREAVETCVRVAHEAGSAASGPTSSAKIIALAP